TRAAGDLLALEVLAPEVAADADCNGASGSHRVRAARRGALAPTPRVEAVRRRRRRAGDGAKERERETDPADRPDFPSHGPVWSKVLGLITLNVAGNGAQ